MASIRPSVLNKSPKEFIVYRYEQDNPEETLTVRHAVSAAAAERAAKKLYSERPKPFPTLYNLGWSRITPQDREWGMWL